MIKREKRGKEGKEGKKGRKKRKERKERKERGKSVYLALERKSGEKSSLRRIIGPRVVLLCEK